MRTMYDAINPNLIPGNPEIVAGYVNGKWPSFYGYDQFNQITRTVDKIPSIVNKFPNAIHVSIAVSADADAQVLDCERFDATPDECPGWALRQRSRGIDPTIYVSNSQWLAVIQAFHNQNVPTPHYWIANYDGFPQIPLGAVAKQYQNTAGYDLSVVQAYWPGVDPNPLTKNILDVNQMIFVNNDDPNKLAFLLIDGKTIWITDGNDEIAMAAGNVPRSYVSAAFFNRVVQVFGQPAH